MSELFYVDEVAAAADEPEPPVESPPPSYVEASEQPSPLQHPFHARLCTIFSWKDGSGYGFSMQAQKGTGKTGQYIGKIDAEAPAEAAGLRSGDRIIEVNGTNIETASHKEVVDKIKSVPDSVQLLVVDEEADAYFKEKGIQVSSSSDDCVERLSSPTTKPTSGEFV
jgi:membrane-associated protease RseP (regulator of RpoE activity)